jgi:CRISPR/Cas system-associated exonuclease Cas4 (RecB family)
LKNKTDLAQLQYYTTPNKNPEKVYISYKSRNQVEEMIDMMKNILEADKIYYAE